MSANTIDPINDHLESEHEEGIGLCTLGDKPYFSDSIKYKFDLPVYQEECD